MMKPKKILLIGILFLLGAVLSACSGAAYGSTSWHGLTASSDTAYLAAGTHVYAVDVKTGTEKWRYPAKLNAKIAFYANPVLTEDGQLLVPSYDHKLYSLNPTNGSENWNFSGSTNRLIGSPLVLQNMIFQPSADGHIYVVDLTGKQALPPIKTGGDAIWTQPVTNPGCGCIYIASMDHMVYSFDAATGRQLWVSQDLEGSMVDTPAVGIEGTIYVGTFGNEMIALDGTNGTVKWRFTTEDWVWSGPALANDVLYFGDLSGTFYALDPSNGRELWRIQPNNSIVDSPVISGDNIYFTTEADTLYSLNPAGAIVYSKVIGGVIYSSPVIVGDTILVAPTGFDAVLVALTLDGNQKWTFTPAK